MELLNSISGKGVLLIGLLLFCASAGLYVASGSMHMDILVLFAGIVSLLSNVFFGVGSGLTAHQKGYSPVASIIWCMVGLFCCCLGPIVVLFIPEK